MSGTQGRAEVSRTTIDDERAMTGAPLDAEQAEAMAARLMGDLADERRAPVFSPSTVGSPVPAAVAVDR